MPAFASARAPERPPADVLARLKTETRPLHDKIEANPKFARLMAEDLDLDEYGRMLARLLPFHQRVEADIARALAPWALELSLSARAKTPLLIADMIALAVRERAPSFHRDLAMDAPSAWGALYVIEGATLGGRVILKRLSVTLGLDAGRGASYYAGYGEATGAYWQSFRAALAGVSETRPEWSDAIVQSAARTFSALDQWMEGA